MTQAHQYGVKSVKTFRSMDGGGYEGYLTREGKKIAMILDEGNGGEIHIDWIDSKERTVKYQMRQYNDNVVEVLGTPEEALFGTFIFNHPQVDGFSSKLFMSDHIFIDDLVNAVLLEKQIAGQMKRKVIAEVDDKVYNFSVKAPQTIDSVILQVKNKYPQANVLNKMAIKEVIEVYKKHNLIA